MTERKQIIPIRKTESNRNFIGSLAWRRACGLMTLSDYGDAYVAARTPRGAYNVPLPEDLTNGR